MKVKRSALQNKGSRNKKNVDITIFTPKSDKDMFMSCVSYWLYESTCNRTRVRKRLLLYFARKCFGRKFATINDVVNAYFANTLMFKRNDYVTTVCDAMDFITQNMIDGVVTSMDMMCMIAANCLHATILLKTNTKHNIVKYGSRKHTENEMYIEYYRNGKICKLKYVNGLRHTKTKPMHQLYVSKHQGEMTPVCEFERVDSVHTCRIDEINKKWVYTVLPTEGYRHLRPCWIYVQHSNAQKKVQCVSSTDGTLNPYFFIDDKQADYVIIYVIQADTQEFADMLIKKKHKNKIVLV